ncbi:MAG: hypothetical protein KGJ80_21060 [Chloroflexota bacterium]|nr:hypothetical protein [Chloroflexota bacterium]
MNANIPSGLRYTFVLGAVASFITGVPSLVAPLLVIQLSGLDPKATPAIQQAGALTVGYFVASLMCLQATNREQVKIPMASSAIVFVLSAIGAFYYVVLQGVVAPGLIVILVASILMAILLGYYYRLAA